MACQHFSRNSSEGSLVTGHTEMIGLVELRWGQQGFTSQGVEQVFWVPDVGLAHWHFWPNHAVLTCVSITSLTELKLHRGGPPLVKARLEPPLSGLWWCQIRSSSFQTSSRRCQRNSCLKIHDDTELATNNRYSTLVNAQEATATTHVDVMCSGLCLGSLRSLSVQTRGLKVTHPNVEHLVHPWRLCWCVHPACQIKIEEMTSLM